MLNMKSQNETWSLRVSCKNLAIGLWNAWQLANIKFVDIVDNWIQFSSILVNTHFSMKASIRLDHLFLEQRWYVGKAGAINKIAGCYFVCWL